MIRSALLAVLLVLPVTAGAQDREKTPTPVATEPSAPAEVPKALEPKPPTKQEDTTIDKYRTPFEVLGETNIGMASRAVLFDWRKATAGFGVTTSALLELNNYFSARVGGFVRIPSGNLTFGLGVTYVFTTGSPSSQMLALTPYRQTGRPNRVEFDINFNYALFEGVATPRLFFLPTVELVFALNVDLRYLYYPGALGKANFGQVIEAIVAPKISQREIDYLEPQRLPGMAIDTQRYGPMAGFSLDMYFHTGIFIQPKAMLGIPLLAAVTNSRLGWWWELSMSLGLQL